MSSMRRMVSFDERLNEESFFNPSSPPAHARRERSGVQQHASADADRADNGGGLEESHTAAADGARGTVDGDTGQGDPGRESGRVFQYAQMIGIDLARDSQFVWIADEMARAELPSGWAEVAGIDGRLNFFDTSTQLASDEHPMLPYYRSLFLRNKGQAGDALPRPQPARQQQSTAAPAAGPTARSEQAPDGSASDSSSADSADSDYEAKQARRRARRRARRGYSSSDDDNDSAGSGSDKENGRRRSRRSAASKARQQRRRRERGPTAREQALRLAEARSRGPVKRLTARERALVRDTRHLSARSRRHVLAS
jgi:hypothetical protein